MRCFEIMGPSDVTLKQECMLARASPRRLKVLILRSVFLAGVVAAVLGFSVMDRRRHIFDSRQATIGTQRRLKSKIIDPRTSFLKTTSQHRENVLFKSTREYKEAVLVKTPKQNKEAVLLKTTTKQSAANYEHDNAVSVRFELNSKGVAVDPECPTSRHDFRCITVLNSAKFLSMASGVATPHSAIPKIEASAQERLDAAFTAFPNADSAEILVTNDNASFFREAKKRKQSLEKRMVNFDAGSPPANLPTNDGDCITDMTRVSEEFHSAVCSPENNARLDRLSTSMLAMASPSPLATMPRMTLDGLYKKIGPKRIIFVGDSISRQLVSFASCAEKRAGGIAGGGSIELFLHTRHHRKVDDLDAVLSADVIVLNICHHYTEALTDYLHLALNALREWATQSGHTLIVMTCSAQHFPNHATGMYSPLGVPNVNNCHCTPNSVTSPFIDSQREGIRLADPDGTWVKELDFYHMTNGLHYGHLGPVSTSLAKGVCDCTHWCYNPSLWDIVAAQLYILVK
jgi:hypothetical protein